MGNPRQRFEPNGAILISHLAKGWMQHFPQFSVCIRRQLSPDSSGEFHGLTADLENLILSNVWPERPSQFDAGFLCFSDVLLHNNGFQTGGYSPVQWALGAHNEGHGFPTTTSEIEDSLWGHDTHQIQKSIGQNWIGQNWIGQNWIGPNWPNQDGQNGIGQSRSLLFLSPTPPKTNGKLALFLMSSLWSRVHVEERWHKQTPNVVIVCPGTLGHRLGLDHPEQEIGSRRRCSARESSRSSKKFLSNNVRCSVTFTSKWAWMNAASPKGQ